MNTQKSGLIPSNIGMTIVGTVCFALAHALSQLVITLVLFVIFTNPNGASPDLEVLFDNHYYIILYALLSATSFLVIYGFMTKYMTSADYRYLPILVALIKVYYLIAVFIAGREAFVVLNMALWEMITIFVVWGFAHYRGYFRPTA